MAAIRALHIRSGALRSSSALIAWILWGLSVALLIGLIPLLIAVTAAASTNPAIPEQIAQKLAVSGPTAIYLVIGYLAVLACSTLGAVIITRQPENRVGWIFCIVGLANTSKTFAAYYASYTLLAQPGSLPGGLAAAWRRPGGGLVAELDLGGFQQPALRVPAITVSQRTSVVATLETGRMDQRMCDSRAGFCGGLSYGFAVELSGISSHQ